MIRRHFDVVMLAAAVLGLASGVAAALVGADGFADGIWMVTAGLGLVLSVWWVLDAARHGRLGVDAIALLAVLGTLVVGEYFAGAVITVMLTTGRSLEAWAAGRAERELHALLGRAPRVAHRYVDGELIDAPVEDVAVGDLLLVQPGEVVPVDGTVRSGPAVIDDSALTGESLPVQRAVGETVRGGAVNAGGPFDVVATTTASDSTYAGIVRLVEEATANELAVRAPCRSLRPCLLGPQRGGRRRGVGRSPVSWGGRSPCLVVATPCPLILAAPVAIVAGLSRAARLGVIVKGGGPLERLADAEILLFDKTGTLTAGRPMLGRDRHRRRARRRRGAPARGIARSGLPARAGVRDRRAPVATAGSSSNCRQARAKSPVRAFAARSASATWPSARRSWVGVQRRRAVGGGRSATKPSSTGRSACSSASTAHPPAPSLLSRPDPTRRRPHDPQPAPSRHPPSRHGDRRSAATWPPRSAP